MIGNQFAEVSASDSGVDEYELAQASVSGDVSDAESAVLDQLAQVSVSDDMTDAEAMAMDQLA